jgi:ADP-heptose:LPS heptosyltransferase
VLATPAALHPLAELAGLRCVDAAPLQPPPVAGARLGVNLHGRGPQSHAALRAAGVRELWGFGLPGQPPWPEGVHERERWCALLRHHGVPADPADLRLDPPPPGAHAGATVIHPGAAFPARRWPPERWRAVAAALDGPVVASAGPGEPDLEGVPTWRGPVLGLAALVAHARLLLCADTGVAHLASAFGTPSVVLFGPVPPHEWGPPEGGPHEVLWSGRRGDPHGQVLDPGLAEIEVEDVLRAAARAARRSSRRAGAGAPWPARGTPASG